MDAILNPAGRAESETRGPSQGGVVGASSAPAGRAESEARCSIYGCTVDASLAPAGRAENDLSAASTPGTDQGNREDPPAVLSGRAAHELSDLGRPPVTVRGRIRGRNQRLRGKQFAEQQKRLNPEIADALLAAVYARTKSGSIQKSISWTTADAMSMTAGGPVENKGESNVCMPSDFLADVELPPQSAAGVERSE